MQISDQSSVCKPDATTCSSWSLKGELVGATVNASTDDSSLPHSMMHANLATGGSRMDNNEGAKMEEARGTGNSWTGKAPKRTGVRGI